MTRNGEPTATSLDWSMSGERVGDSGRKEMLAEAQRRVLELAMQDTPLEQTLGALVETVERHSSAGVLASILLLTPDGAHLRDGAAPSLPQA